MTKEQKEKIEDCIKEKLAIAHLTSSFLTDLVKSFDEDFDKILDNFIIDWQSLSEVKQAAESKGKTYNYNDSYTNIDLDIVFNWHFYRPSCVTHPELYIYLNGILANFVKSIEFDNFIKYRLNKKNNL